MAGRRVDNDSKGGRGKYEGFKGKYDEDGVFIFTSKEERDRYQIATYGHVRNGFREPDEPPDERPLIMRDACQCRGCRKEGAFWRDESERLTYEHAVETNPRGADEGAMSYVARIAAIVAGRIEKAGKVMPHRLGAKAFQKRLNELEAQREPGDDDGPTE